MTNRNFGGELVTLLAIDQPLCSREWGDAFASPTGGCTAVLGSSADEKCYNTRKTCAVPNAYNPGTLTLTFGSERQSQLARNYGYVIPCIQILSTSTGSINLGGMDEEMSGIGTREQVTITCKDLQHSDLLVDKYRLQRNVPGLASSGSPARVWNPARTGTFWGKWLARNPYHFGYAARVYQGYVGQAMSAMRVRYYIIERIEGPTDGIVKIVLKDIFAFLDDKKAVAPVANTGRIGNANGITAAVQSPGESLTLLPVGIGNSEYAASGYVCIGSEIIGFTRSGDTLSLNERGAKGTTAKAHDLDDLVQQCLTLAPGRAHDHTWTLLCNYTTLGNIGSPTGSSHINKATWDTRAASITDLYSATVAKPTPVNKLVGELAMQAGFTVYPDVSTGMVEFVALRPGVISPTVTDGAWIKDMPSVQLRRQDDKRASQVWVYYAQIDPTKDLEEETNFRSRLRDLDGDAESSTQYGTPQIRKIFSRWIPQFGRSSADGAAERLRAMFRDPPLEATFPLHISRDGELELARYFYLQTEDVQDFTGAADTRAMAPVQIGLSDSEITVKAQQVTFAPASGSTARNIYIENDCFNINLRDIHDALFETPLGGSPSQVVNYFVITSVIVGSVSASVPAMRTGTWPAGCTLTLDNDGRIQGKGGRPGDGAQAGSSTLDASNGETGGDAILVEYPFTIDNINGQIWAGGGGGGAGQTRGEFIPANWQHQVIAGGGAGGAGAGSDPGDFANPGASTGNFALAPAGYASAATTTAGGVHGVGAGPDPIRESDDLGGPGGDGGGPGLPGSNGSLGSGGFTGGSVGTGGLAGYAINGQSFVTWVGSPNGDRGDARGRFV